MSCSCPHHIQEAVRAVHALREAKKRIDFPQRPKTTYFSGQDIWLYDARADFKVCPICLGYADQASSMGGFNGNYIRGLFPYLVILDENSIGGPGSGGDGLAHPNCRCRLIRFIGNPEDSTPAQKALIPKDNQVNNNP